MRDLIGCAGSLLFGASMFYGLVQVQEYNSFAKAFGRDRNSCYQRDLSEISFSEKMETLGLIVGEKVYCEEVPIIDISIVRIGDVGMDLGKVAYLSE
tara:strand:+ start:224 stop:514 length:291 start_codon:yes stop_codon:yes gene_type:complete